MSRNKHAWHKALESKNKKSLWRLCVNSKIEKEINKANSGKMLNIGELGKWYVGLLI